MLTKWGTIDSSEFIEFATLGKYESKKKDWAERRANQHIASEEMSNLQRKNRIRQKTVLADEFTTLAMRLRHTLSEYLIRTHKSPEQLFVDFDDDAGGTIDKVEFLAGLHMCGVEITFQQLTIWSLV